MEQRTGFAQLRGHRIAYAAVGRGPPLLMPSWWVSHIASDWETQSFRSWIEWLAARREVIRYDRLGTGLSDRIRAPETLSLDFEVETLAAVTEQLELERPALLGISCGAAVAARYAAQHPERVDRLVLYGAYADGREIGPADARRGVAELVRTHWGLGSRLLSDVFGSPREDRARFIAFQRRAADSEVAADLLELIYSYDVREDLTALECPALIVHREADRTVPARLGRAVATLIPGARFEPVAGAPHLPWYGDGRSVIAAFARFLGVDVPEPGPQKVEPSEALAGLSTREREVLALVAEGLSEREIAERLVLSPHTVHRHEANIRRKLGIRSRAAAAALAARADLV